MNDKVAVEFLKLVTENRIDEAYGKYVNMSGKHHNMFTLKGFDNLQKGMEDSNTQFPDKTLDIKNVFGYQDIVAVHSHFKFSSDHTGMSVVHMFKFQDGKIVEMWDLAQEIPKDLINSDGAF